MCNPQSKICKSVKSFSHVDREDYFLRNCLELGGPLDFQSPCPPHCYATAWAARGITFSTCPSVHACRDGRLLVVRVCLSDVRVHARPVGSSHRCVRAVSHRQRLARTQNNRTRCTFALLASAIRGSCKCCLACMWFCL